MRSYLATSHWAIDAVRLNAPIRQRRQRARLIVYSDFRDLFGAKFVTDVFSDLLIVDFRGWAGAILLGNTNIIRIWEFTIMRISIKRIQYAHSSFVDDDRP